MSIRHLLLVTALIEAGAGVALVSVPSAAAELLLAAPLESFAAIALGRIAGAALLALGVANWLAQYDARSNAARGLVAAMLLYNLAAVAILGAAGASHPAGILLWPGVALHAAMSAWCMWCVMKMRSSQGG